MPPSAALYADLEIRILELQPQGYPVEITLNGEQQFPRGYLDPDLLNWAPTIDPQADGERLLRSLLAGEQLVSAWAQARGTHATRRLRLRIDASAPQLHALPWELLGETNANGLRHVLSASAATPFSRYLAGAWQPGAPILQRPIRMLVAIANPANLQADFGLDPIDPDREWEVLKAATAGLDVQMECFPPRGAQETRDHTHLDQELIPCTLAALERKLQEGFHILHIVGHGAFADDEAVLYLADDDNRVQLVGDQKIAEMLARQIADATQATDDKLRLVFLASCSTATRSPADAFRGLAPKLVAAGVPAVVAMQAPVPLETAQAFGSAFYRQLLRHGQVDLACNEARSALLTADLPGAAIPVLFMRLRNGLLLGQRGEVLGDQAGSFWDTLIPNIKDKLCTPFLGPGVTADLLPSPAELAQELAAKCHYPFPATQSLPRVTQFWSTKDNRRPRVEVVTSMASQFRSRMGLPSTPGEPARSLGEIAEQSHWSDRSRELFESEIHHQLADLGLPLYVTTNFDNFMTLALRTSAGQARREMVKWRDKGRRDVGQPRFSLNPPPSPKAPVVMHLFGADDDPLSMVLTEDDYLDYLARISKDYEYLLPTDVYDAMASTTLLFLGYRLDDLDLKVILRGLLPNLDLQRWDMLHVAVQMESSAADQATQEEVTTYFEKYFAKSKIDVYWGSAQQFVADLHARWQEGRHA
jgi:hypothetical protein